MRFLKHACTYGVTAMLLAAALAAPAAADNYDAKDGNGAHQTFAAKLVAGILHPFHVFEGMFGGAPTPVNMTNAGALDVTCTAGCSASGNNTLGSQGTITAADSATAATAGQGGVNAITGTPTAGSTVSYAIAGAASGGTLTASGTFVATCPIETSFDSGAHYTASSALLRGTNVRTASITGSGAFSVDLNGVTNLRVRCASYTSGTLTVNFTYSGAPGMTKILNGISLVDGTTFLPVDTSPGGSGIGAIGSAVPANAVYIGCRPSTTIPTAAPDGNLTGVRCGKAGNLIATPWAPIDLRGDQSTTFTASTTAATCVAAPGAGITRNVMGITINNSAATDTVVQVLNTDGTTVRWIGTAKANDQRGIVLPGPLKGSATASDFKCKTLTSTSSVTFTINYFDN